jgi:signal transduction histidine kinase
MARRGPGTAGPAERQGILNRKAVLLFFLLPFLGAVILIVSVSALNRAYVRRSMDALVTEQLGAAESILKSALSRSIEEGMSPSRALDIFSGEGDIYYMALLDGERKILAWTSMFEGYLPLSLQDVPAGGSWVIDSPAGRIFNHFGPFSTQDGRTYYLYLGYSLGAFEEMSARSRRNALIVLAIVAAAALVVFRGLNILQSGYLKKAREADEARAEKDRFREISAFTSGVAHEIRNPLNSLSLLFGLMEKRGGPDLREEIALGANEVRKISLIVDRFSDVLKPLQVRPETFPIDEAIESVLASLALEFPAARDRVRFEGNGTLAVRADRELLSLVLTNLLRNALEAGETGGVIVRAERDRKRVRLSVRDKGPGIPPERQGRIFEPFFSTKAGGMGIGLYLASRIVEAHGGKIDVRSREGEGSEFIVQVPGG